MCLDVGGSAQPIAFRLNTAESPLEWSDAELFRYLVNTTTWHEAAEGRLTWGRDDIDAVMDSIEASGGLDDVVVAQHRAPRTVFCGHTPVTDVVVAFIVNWIDTAAGGTMTCMDPVSLRKYQVQIDACDRY